MAETPEDRVLAGRYRLLDVIGRGGMGVVWRAHDELLDRRVAVKRVHSPRALSEDEHALHQRRVLREARNAGRIAHPGVVAIHDVVPASRNDDAVSLVMELVTAPTLHEVLAGSSRLSGDRVAVIAVGLASALTAAHRLGVVHRDVKPANVHLLPDDAVKLVDFGIALADDGTRLTRSGTWGTGPYLAPELFDGGKPGPAVDWWAVGVTLRQLLVGANLFDRESPAATMRAILSEPIPPVDCPPPLSTVIDGLLVRDPALRFTGERVRELLAPGRSGTATGTKAEAPSGGGDRPGTKAESSTASAPGADHTKTWPTGPTRPAPSPPDADTRIDGRWYDEDGAGIAALERRLDYQQRWLGDDPATFVTRHALACRRGQADHPGQAVAELERLLPDATRVLGRRHPLVFTVRLDLARFRAENGDLVSAVVELSQLAHDLESVFGPEHPRTLVARHELRYRRGEVDVPGRRPPEPEDDAATA